MKEQGNQVGEALVERGHVDVGRFHERGAQGVEQRMRGLVRDDVVAEGRGDQAALDGKAGGPAAGPEVAERQVAGLAAVPGVRPADEGPYFQPERPFRAGRDGPRDLTAKRTLER